MTRKSVLECHCQNNLTAAMSLFLLTLFLIQTNNVNVVNSQALINQLAALFRSRSPWPTTFPSAGESSLSEPSFSDLISNHQQTHGKNMNLNLDDFSHFNDLLTGQSINQLNGGESNNGESSGGGGESGMSFYPGAPILATSHPLPQLEMPTGNGGKSVLIAHPVLGPNPNEPPEKVEHKFNTMMVNPLNLLNDNAGLYSQQNQQPKPHRPSAVRNNNNNNNNDRLKNSFHNFAQKLFFPNNGNKNGGNRQPQFQKMIPISGKPPPGGKIIAIPVPVPSNSPLLKNSHFHGSGHNRPQIIAVRQQFPPITSIPVQQQYSSSQHVTSFMGMFSPSPLDMSSYPPTTTTNNASTTTIAATISTNAPSTTSQFTSSSTTTLTTTTTTEMPTRISSFATTPPPTTYQSHRYNTDKAASSERLSSTVITPSPTTTITPSPPIQNIQDVIYHNSHHHLPKNTNNNIHSSPSTLVGAFRYPDPPTPPKMLNMNTRYELQQDQYDNTIKSQWVPQTPSSSSAVTTKSAYFSPPKNGNGNNNANGFHSSISAIPLSPSHSLRGSRSKWKHDDDSSNSASTLNSNRVTNHKSENPNPGFKPSLQLHSFEDTTSGLREFITINPHPLKKKNKNSRDSKSLFHSTTTTTTNPGDEDTTDLPAMESGFRPFNHFAFVNGVSSASISSTTESSMMNKLRNEFTKDIVTANVWSNMDPTAQSAPGFFRQNRQFGDFNGYSNSKPFYAPAPASTSITVGSSYNGGGYNYKNDHAKKQHNNDWVGRFGQSPAFTTTKNNDHHYYSPMHSKIASTTAASSSSSEVYEDWLVPTTKRKKESKDHANVKSNTSTFSISNASASTKFKSPPDCDKFHRFGFCPVTTHYPLGKVEAVGARCNTLLSHLIAPLPKTDVRYDVIVPKNTSSSTKSSTSSNSKKKSSSSSSAGWSWKTFAGKPVCDTKEVKIVPGWAKNEQGQWLIILQTGEWKQEAQISLCAQNSQHEDAMKMKCVQRFTAQRLVVLDPENEERCPVVRSVFLPSACVCLNDEEKTGSGKNDKKSSKHSSRHHKNHKNEHNSTKTKTSPSSKILSGRSLLTSLFGLDLDPSSSENSNTYPSPTLSSSQENDDIPSQQQQHQDSRSDSKSSSEESSKNPLKPSNSPFMVIASDTGETSTESGELRPSGPSKRSITSTLGSSFILSSSHSDNNNDRIRSGDAYSSVQQPNG